MSDDTKIETLVLEDIELDCVNGHILAKAVNQLKWAGLRKNEYGIDHCRAILQQALIKTNLSHINLCFPDVGSDEDFNFVLRAREKIREVEIYEDHGYDAWGNWW